MNSRLSSPSSYVVVGGGIAGLVAARRLALGGATVTILEASDRVGGTVASHTVGGLLLDAGAESFATRGGTVAALATELGLGPEIVAPVADSAWLYQADGTAVPLPATSLLGIPAIPLAADVIRVIGLRAALRAQLDLLIPSGVGRNEPSLGGLVRRRMGPRVLDRLVNPVVRGVHSTDPSELPVDRAAPGLRSLVRNQGSLAHAVRELRANAPAGSAVAGIRGGISRIVIELVADLERLGVDIRTGVRIDTVERDAAVAGGATYIGRVVVAAPGVLGPIHGRTVSLATLVVDEPGLDDAPRGTGLLVAEGAVGVRARALTHATAKWPWLAARAGGKHVLRLSYDNAPAELERVAREDAAILLGVELAHGSVVDFARVEWTRPGPALGAPAGIAQVGESVAGSGLAAVIAQAEAVALGLLGESAPAAGAG